MITAEMIALLKEQSFFQDLPEDYFPLIAECSELANFNEGEYLMRQNQSAECFFLLLKGLVSLRTNMPAQGNMPVETIIAPGALGWSWLIAPYKWYFDAVAVKPTRAIIVHTPCLLGEIEQDRAFGYEMYKRFAEVMVDRLNGVRMQMMDIYAKPEQSSL